MSNNSYLKWSDFYLLYLVSAVDGADMVVFSAAYKALEEDLGFSPRILGLLDSVCACVAALTCILWASYVTTHCPKKLLVYSAVAWGIITLLLGLSSQLWVWLVLRALHGIALAGFAPIVQTMIARSVQEHERGSYYGKVYCFHHLGALIGINISASVSRNDVDFLGMATFKAWRLVFFFVGVLSLILAWAVHLYFAELPFVQSSVLAERITNGRSDGFYSQLKVRMKAEINLFMRYCVSLPSFVIIVCQGCMGCIAFGAMFISGNFLTMWFQLGGMTDSMSGVLVSVMRVGCGIGSMLGGYVGDGLTKCMPNNGRACTAQLSKGISTPIIFTVVYMLPMDHTTPFIYGFCLLLFGSTTAWTEPGCNAPVLSEIVPDDQRASILAWSHATSRVSGAIFGAYLTGFMAEKWFGYHALTAQERKELHPDIILENFHALTSAITVLTIIPWTIAFLIYGGLHWSYKRDKHQAKFMVARGDKCFENEKHRKPTRCQ